MVAGGVLPHANHEVDIFLPEAHAGIGTAGDVAVGIGPGVSADGHVGRDVAVKNLVGGPEHGRERMAVAGRFLDAIGVDPGQDRLVIDLVVAGRRTIKYAAAREQHVVIRICAGAGAGAGARGGGVAGQGIVPGSAVGAQKVKLPPIVAVGVDARIRRPGEKGHAPVVGPDGITVRGGAP